MALQVIKCWRQHIGHKTGAELLQQYGVPGLLISGGVILGKLVQFGAPADAHTQLEVSPVLTPSASLCWVLLYATIIVAH